MIVQSSAASSCRTKPCSEKGKVVERMSTKPIKRRWMTKRESQGAFECSCLRTQTWFQDSEAGLITSLTCQGESGDLQRTGMPADNSGVSCRRRSEKREEPDL